MNSDEFLSLALRNTANEIIVGELFAMALPDPWLVSGCLMQTVWNVLTQRPVDYGINDYDIFYFDPDTSWEAEDAVIHRLQDRLAPLGVAIEARNQARVHLWYPGKHGVPYPALSCSTEGIDRFLSRTTRIGLRRIADGYDIYAPNGFDDVAEMIVRPNRTANFSAANYTTKAARWKALWPEITVMAAQDERVLCSPDEAKRNPGPSNAD
ncbi:nucleotidyltransferase family protein [Bradyrhizobium erythrophlei]|uniref:nucleotidyltransferase family protein n=1 Tax=Bradyrhizobium erythrophlei TaxID=1437360 RepID=UPI0035E680C6